MTMRINHTSLHICKVHAVAIDSLSEWDNWNCLDFTCSAQRAECTGSVSLKRGKSRVQTACWCKVCLSLQLNCWRTRTQSNFNPGPKVSWFSDINNFQYFFLVLLLLTICNSWNYSVLRRGWQMRQLRRDVLWWLWFGNGQQKKPPCDGAYFPGYADPVMPTPWALYGPPGWRH